MKITTISCFCFLFLLLAIENSLAQQEQNGNKFKRYCFSMEVEQTPSTTNKVQNAFGGAKWEAVKKQFIQLGGKSMQLYTLEGEQLLIIDTEEPIRFWEAMKKLKNREAYKKWRSSAEPFQLDFSRENGAKGWHLMERIYKLEQKQNYEPENGILKKSKGPHKRYVMTLPLVNDPEMINEYKKIHRKANVWPQIEKNMKTVGIKDMEIYLRGNQAFLIMDTQPDFDFDRDAEKWSQLPREKEWQNYVSKYQQVDPESSAKVKWKLMERL